MVQSTLSPKTVKPSKPAKPHADFPLFPHATRRWAKKIRGKLHYFGPWDDPQAALDKWLAQKDDLLAGRKPRIANGEATVRDLCNRFLTSKKLLLDAGEITPRTWQDYYNTSERVVSAFGATRIVDDLASDDFEGLRADLAKRWGPVALGNEIQRVRVLFKYAYDTGLIKQPVRYGPGFKRPSKKTLRQARAAKGPRMFEAAELRKIIAEAGTQLRAMVLLGVNVGFGNTDVGTLPLSALDLRGGWVNYPRPKTGIQRRGKLWPETVQALRKAIDKRHTPKDDALADRVFITRLGKSWAKDSCDNPVSKEMTKVLKALDLHRPGLGFYTLRHVFETIAGGCRDQVAVDHVMGHVDSSMAGAYRERIEDDRLETVAAHVHGWLFPKNGRGRKAKK